MYFFCETPNDVDQLGCRLRSPREFFHATTSSTFHYLQDHCEKEHPSICDYLLAMTDRQLFEMNCQLNVSQNMHLILSTSVEEA
jgi:hypothetical protein